MPAHDTVLPNLITDVAREDPARPYVVNAETGEVWTYGQADAEAWRWADAYYQAGVRAGDTVLTMLPPCVEAVASWLGIGRLGALVTRALDAGAWESGGFGITFDASTGRLAAVAEFAARRRAIAPNESVGAGVLAGLSALSSKGGKLGSELSAT